MQNSTLETEILQIEPRQRHNIRSVFSV